MVTNADNFDGIVLDTESAFVDVTASDSLYEALKKNQYRYLDLISELIDNSIAGRFDHKPVNIVISFWSESGGADQDKIKKISISDDGQGIPSDHLAKALSLAAIQTKDSLNEHGMGMKVAIVSLGTLELLSTKTLESEFALEVDRLAFGRIPLSRVKVDRESGTEIRIKNLEERDIRLNKYVDLEDDRRRTIKKVLPKWLGARFRMFLADGIKPGLKKRANVTLKHFRDDEEVLEDRVEIEPVFPIYEFNPEKSARVPSPVKKLRTQDPDAGTWRAELTLGLAASQSESKVPSEFKIDLPVPGEPYHVSLRNQGVDVLMNDRVITFSRLFRNVQSHNSYNRLRGELNLIEGFQTTTTKNDIAGSKEWDDCRRQVEKALNTFIKKFLPEKPPRGKREKQLSKMLLEKLRSDHPDKEFDHSQSIQFAHGEIDILNLTDNEPYELKENKAAGSDVWQLFGYMSIQNCRKGYLVANGKTNSCNPVLTHIKKRYPKIQIEFKDFEDFGISLPR